MVDTIFGRLTPELVYTWLSLLCTWCTGQIQCTFTGVHTQLKPKQHAWLTSNAVCTPQFSPLTPLHNGTIPCQRDLVSRNLVHNFNFLYQNDKKQTFSLHNNTKQVTTCLCIQYLTSWNLLMLLYSWNSIHARFKGNDHCMTWAKYYKWIILFYE